jgi:hypothetical protein
MKALRVAILMAATILIAAPWAKIKAQTKKPKITFKETEFDFGKIHEEQGKVTHVFEFTNTGGEPLILNNVRSSCGCTVADWPKKPIPPGGKGQIKAIYNASHRPGRFTKTITVNSNAENPIVVLRIKGEVIPRKKTLKDIYPQKFGVLRARSNHIAMMKIKNTETKTDSLEVINDSDQPITIGFQLVPQHLTVKAVPEKLGPHKKGHIVVTYDAKKKNDWGYVIDRMYVTINGKRITTNRLNVSANIVEDFSNVDLKKAPKIEFDQIDYDFGEVTDGDIVTHKFTFKNTGKGDLIIRKVKSSCGCTATLVGDKVIKKGKKSYIEAKFNSRGRGGHKQYKTITVISNDPEHPQVILRLHGMVKRKDANNGQNAGKPGTTPKKSNNNAKNPKAKKDKKH